MQSLLPPEQSSQRPPEICSSFPRTRDAATFFRADSQISVTVVLEIFICLAHSLCVIPSKSTSLRTSNSSTVRMITSAPPASSGEGLWEGTKVLKAGIWQMRRLFCGLANGHLLILTLCFDSTSRNSRDLKQSWGMGAEKDIDCSCSTRDFTKNSGSTCKKRSDFLELPAVTEKMFPT